MGGLPDRWRRPLVAAAGGAVLLSLLLPAAPLASATLLNFDDLAHNTVVTEQYPGISFNDARIVRCASDPSGCAAARSGQNALRPAIAFEFENEPLIMLFDELQLTVSLYASTGIGSPRSILVRAFGPSGQVDTAGASVTSAWSRFEVSHAGGITAVQVTGTAPGMDDNQFAIDDLTFEPVPPPATPPPTASPTSVPSKSASPSASASAKPSSSASAKPSTPPSASAPTTATPRPTASPTPSGPQPPSITILTPRDGLALASTDPRVELSYEVRDDGRVVRIEEWLWRASPDGIRGDPVYDEPWVECASAARCFGIPYRGRETVFLPAPGLYQLGVRATDDDGNVVTEVVSLSFAAPVDVWVMGMEWNQAVQDVVYTHLDRAVGSPGSKTVRAGTSRVPLVQGKAVAVRVYLGLRRPALVRVSAAGLPASGRLTVTVTHGSETSTTTLSPVTNPSCANHLGEDPGSGCTGRVMVPLSFGHPSHPTSLDRILVDPFYDVELAAASDFDLDLVWRRLQPERTLNFVVPPELVSSIQPGDRVELRADVEPLGLAEATAGDNRFTLAVEDIAPPADLDLRVVNVDMPDAPGGAGAAATEAQVGAALDGFMHLVPYSGLAEETATPFSYDGHFKRLRVHVLGIEVADLFIDQCPTLWLELLMAFGLDRERTTLGLTPPQIELLQHPSNGGEPDCKGMGWRLPGEDGSYVGGVAHTVTPSNLGTIGTTAGAFAPADVGATDFWDLVAVGAQELYHAHLDRRHVGDFHDERSGCFVDDDRFVEMAAAFLLDWDVDSDCTKPAPHQHGTMGEYPSAVEPLRGDIGAMGLRIEEAGSDWNLTLYDPCPMPLGIRIDPRDSIPWINERWSVFSPAHDCRRRDRDRSHDFLSYGEHRWTSVEQFSPLNIGNPGPNPRVLPAVNALRASSHGSPEPTVGAGLELDENPPFRLWGVITADGGAGIGEAIPVGSMSSTPLAGEGDPSGVHLQVTRTDGSSSNLAPFPSVQSAHGGDVHAIFLAELPPGPPPQRVALMVGGETWTSVEASASAPTVNLLEPNGGDEWTGGQPRTIRWEGEDADSDALSYRVEYSADGGATWTPIGVSRSATSIEVAGDQLPAGDRAIVRVVASDGLRFAADVSDGTFCNQVQGDCASMPVDGDAAPVGLEAGGLAVLVVAVLGAGAGAIIWRRRRAAAST